MVDAVPHLALVDELMENEWQPLDAPTRSSAVHTFSNDQLRPTLGPLGLRIPVVDIDLSTE